MAVFLLGAVVGILSFSKLLHWLLERWNRETLIVLAGFIIGSLVKVWPWSNMEAIVCSQFPKVAQLGSAAEKLGKHTELYSGEEIQQLMKSYYDSIERCIPMVDKHIWGAIIFAIIGFSLVTGIELAGKYIARKQASKA